MNTIIQTNNLKTFRKQAGFTQKQIAKLLGMKSEDRISLWENGLAVPGLTNLFKLSTLYNISPFELYPDLLVQIRQSTHTLQA